MRAGVRKVVEEIPNLEVVAEVGDGPALFAALEREKPGCCVLIDIAMPDFELIQAINEIRAQYPNVAIQRIVDGDGWISGRSFPGWLACRSRFLRHPC